MAKVSIPAGLQKFFKGQTKIEIDGATVQDLLGNIENTFPETKRKLVDSDGVLCRYLRIFVDGEDISNLEQFETELNRQSQVKILMALAGG